MPALECCIFHCCTTVPLSRKSPLASEQGRGCFHPGFSLPSQYTTTYDTGCWSSSPATHWRLPFILPSCLIGPLLTCPPLGPETLGLLANGGAKALPQPLNMWNSTPSLSWPVTWDGPALAASSQVDHPICQPGFWYPLWSLPPQPWVVGKVLWQ